MSLMAKILRRQNELPELCRDQNQSWRLHPRRWLLSVAVFVFVASSGCAHEQASVAGHVDMAAQLLAQPSAQQPSAESAIQSDFATPPFYRIEGGDGAAILLLGTVHLGPVAGWKFSPALNQALAKADSFVLELNLRDLDPDDVGSALAELVVIAPPQLLDDLISLETAKLLAEKEALLSKMGMPANARKRLKPWYVAFSLIEVAARESGYPSSASTENAILAAMGDRPLLGLESFDEQLDMLNDLPPNLQDIMLRDTVARLENSVEDVRLLISAWQSGDEKFFLELKQQGLDEMPELEGFYEILLGDRNRRWVPELRSLLDDPRQKDEIVFVGVGALHLFGKDGLVALLRQEGYAVHPIDHARPLEDPSDG